MSSLGLYLRVQSLTHRFARSFIHSFRKYNYVACGLGLGYKANKIHVAFILIELNVPRGILTSK